MILTDKTILKEIEKGSIVVDPFSLDKLGTNSIDLTLSEQYKAYTSVFRYLLNKQTSGSNIPVTEDFYLDSKKNNDYLDITFPEDGLVLLPGQLYICSTNEYTETHNHVPLLSGKSSLARLGLNIHITAGFGDVGFCGKWTLELSVVAPLKIYPNMPIAQIYYETISEIPNIPYYQKPSAKYHNQMVPETSKMHLNNFS